MQQVRYMKFFLLGFSWNMIIIEQNQNFKFDDNGKYLCSEFIQ